MLKLIKNMILMSSGWKMTYLKRWEESVNELKHIPAKTWLTMLLSAETRYGILVTGKIENLEL